MQIYSNFVIVFKNNQRSYFKMANKYLLGEKVLLQFATADKLDNSYISAVNVKDNPGVADGTNKEPGKLYTYDVIIPIANNLEVETGEQIIIRDVDERIIKPTET